MRAEIISIGTELTSGQNLDTNGQWLSRELAKIGIPTAFHTTVGDDLADNITVFRTATERADLVLTTGGLGPTQDDLTREVLAACLGVDLVENAEALTTIRRMFAERHREMPERNRVQALFPAGSEMLVNRCGTAPGIWCRIGKAWVGSMPGVPSEMFVMFAEQIVPRLRTLGLAGGVLIERKINTFGLGESAVEAKLPGLIARGRVPEVGITASDATISLRILARAATLAEAEAQIAPIEAIIRERLGDLVFGTDSEDLQTVTVRLLTAKRRTLSTVEGVTGGLVSRRLTEVAGASQWYRGGLVAYSDALTTDILGIDPELIATHGTVSKEVVEASASRCRAFFGTDLAVATVGIAGPLGGTDDKPIGRTFVALASASGVISLDSHWPGNRLEIQSRCAKQALNLIRLHLLHS